MGIFSRRDKYNYEQQQIADNNQSQPWFTETTKDNVTENKGRTSKVLNNVVDSFSPYPDRSSLYDRPTTDEKERIIFSDEFLADPFKKFRIKSADVSGINYVETLACFNEVYKEILAKHERIQLFFHATEDLNATISPGHIEETIIGGLSTVVGLTFISFILNDSSQLSINDMSQANAANIDWIRINIYFNRSIEETLLLVVNSHELTHALRIAEMVNAHNPYRSINSLKGIYNRFIKQNDAEVREHKEIASFTGKFKAIHKCLQPILYELARAKTILNGKIQYSGVAYLNSEGIAFFAYDSFYNSYIHYVLVMIINYNNLIQPSNAAIQQSAGIIFHGDYIQLNFPTQSPHDGVLTRPSNHKYYYPNPGFRYEEDN